jgi:hypothetical protein
LFEVVFIREVWPGPAQVDSTVRGPEEIEVVSDDEAGRTYAARLMKILAQG